MFQVIVQLYTVFCFPEYNYFNTYDLSTLLDVFKKDELVTSDTKKILFTLLRFLSCILGKQISVKVYHLNTSTIFTNICSVSAIFIMCFRQESYI